MTLILVDSLENAKLSDQGHVVEHEQAMFGPVGRLLSGCYC